jgi:hypothetical protein
MSNDAQRMFELFLFVNEAIFGIPQLIGAIDPPGVCFFLFEKTDRFSFLD